MDKQNILQTYNSYLEKIHYTYFMNQKDSEIQKIQDKMMMIDKYPTLFSLKKQTEDAKIEFDATVSLIDSIKAPMRAEIKKKQDRLDKEFETLFVEIIKTEDSKKLITALCS